MPSLLIIQKATLDRLVPDKKQQSYTFSLHFLIQLDKTAILMTNKFVCNSILHNYLKQSKINKHLVSHLKSLSVQLHFKYSDLWLNFSQKAYL